MARFYGWTPDVIRQMKAEDFDVACRMIPEIRSAELLDEIAVSSYPNMKKSSQEKMHRNIHRTAYPTTESSIERTTKDLALLLSGGGG